MNNCLHKMWTEFPLLQEDLIKIYSILEKELSNANNMIRELLLNQINNKAKLVRPALMILMGRCLNNSSIDDNFLGYGAALELLHMATLVHDDVIDESRLRRGTPTLYDKIGNRKSIYAGDFLLAKSFYDISKYAGDKEDIVFASNKIMDILDGELLQMEYQGNLSIDMGVYLNIVSYKTGNLLALASYEGARLAGYKNKKFWEFGMNIGISFQIIDDLLDIVDLGRTKEVGIDLKNGNYTLPLILSLKDKELSSRILAIKDDNERICDIIKKSDVVDKCKKIALSYTNKCFSLLEELNDSPYKEYLHKLMNLLIMRSL